jgi:hypothetical protein
MPTDAKLREEWDSYCGPALIRTNWDESLGRELTDAELQERQARYDAIMAAKEPDFVFGGVQGFWDKTRADAMREAGLPSGEHLVMVRNGKVDEVLA